MGRANLLKLILALRLAIPPAAMRRLVHLAHLSEFERVNAVYQRHFPEARPVRITVGAALIGGARMENHRCRAPASAPVSRPACHSLTTSSITGRRRW